MKRLTVTGNLPGASTMMFTQTKGYKISAGSNSKLHKQLLLSLLAIACLYGCHKDKTPGKDVDPDPVVTQFTIPEESVQLNPSGYAPLCAVVTFTSPINGHTEIIVKGKNGEASDIEHTFTDNGTQHQITVAGLYADYDNTVEISVIDDKQNRANSTISITTDALPPTIPNYINFNVTDRTKMESGLSLVSSFSNLPNPPSMPYMVDSFGDIRWILDYRTHPQLNQLFYDDGIARLKNGNFYFADQKLGIFEIDLLGNVVHSWDLHGYVFHHEVHEKPDGNFLISVTKPESTNSNGQPTVEDYILEIDRNSGAIVNTWDLKESLDVYRRAMSDDSQDWIHVNAVLYDETDNTIIVSGRVQGVVKLTYDNHVKWILGPHRGWASNSRGEDMNQFLLKPLDASGNLIADNAVLDGSANHPDFEWNWYQHSPIHMPGGNLMVFDNGDNRNFTGSVNYSRAVEYKIDPVNMTVQQVWAYGKERGEETFSRIVSSVKFLPGTKHVLFSPGFQVPNAQGMGGKSVEIDYVTKQVISELSVSSANGWGFHRVYRMSLYPEENSNAE